MSKGLNELELFRNKVEYFDEAKAYDDIELILKASDIVDEKSVSMNILRNVNGNYETYNLYVRPENHLTAEQFDILKAVYIHEDE